MFNETGQEILGFPKCINNYVCGRIFPKLPKHSRFPVIHKVGNGDIFLLLQLKNKEDRKISHFNMNSKQHDTCFRFIPIRSCTNLPMLSTLCITERPVRGGRHLDHCRSISV